MEIVSACVDGDGAAPATGEPRMLARTVATHGTIHRALGEQGESNNTYERRPLSVS
jgi:hypothetical protein